MLGGLGGLVIVLVLVVAVVAIVFPITVKNGLITRDEAANEAWAQIAAQLQRRADLIPNLVATVKGYATHEKDVFTAISEARAGLLAAKGPADAARASATLDIGLGRLLAIAENYPQLKADATFIRLQDELAGTENRIAVARTRYNQSVKDFNAAIRTFPGSLFASGMELAKRDYYEPPDAAAVQAAPEVKF
jgi:LemA protein